MAFYPVYPDFAKIYPVKMKKILLISLVALSNNVHTPDKLTSLRRFIVTALLCSF